MKKVLVSLSGGVESTALLKHGKDLGYDVEALHTVFDNKTAFEGKAARKIAKIYDIPYSEIVINAQEYNDKYPTTPRADHPWWATGLIIAGPVGAYDEIWFGTYLGETPPGAPGPAGVMLILQSADCQSKLKSPLYLKNKKEQWDMLSPKVQSCIVSCIKQYKDGKTCWEKIDGDLGKVCQKCKEWKKWNIVRDA